MFLGFLASYVLWILGSRRFIKTPPSRNSVFFRKMLGGANCFGPKKNSKLVNNPLLFKHILVLIGFAYFLKCSESQNFSRFHNRKVMFLNARRSQLFWTQEICHRAARHQWSVSNAFAVVSPGIFELF